MVVLFFQGRLMHVYLHGGPPKRSQQEFMGVSRMAGEIRRISTLKTWPDRNGNRHTSRTSFLTADSISKVIVATTSEASTSTIKGREWSESPPQQFVGALRGAVTKLKPQISGDKSLEQFNWSWLRSATHFQQLSPWWDPFRHWAMKTKRTGTTGDTGKNKNDQSSQKQSPKGITRYPYCSLGG